MKIIIISKMQKNNNLHVLSILKTILHEREKLCCKFVRIDLLSTLHMSINVKLNFQIAAFSLGKIVSKTR